MPRRVLTALVLAGSLVLGGCQNPDGSTDWGSTALLGAGIGAAALLAVGAASDGGGPRHHGRGYYRGRGHHRGHGGW
jgi:hypothetical protein